MIKKLRRKFVIINMSLVAVILCVVLGMFCFTRVHAFRAESEIAMRQMLDSPRSKEPPENDTKPHSPSLDFGPGGRNPAFNSTPVFLVTLDENNEITDTNSSGSYTVTDTLSEAAVSAAFAVSEDQGYLSNLKLRFILDRSSIELFINDGSKTATTVIPTPVEADEILFHSDGNAVIRVEKYDIVL